MPLAPDEKYCHSCGEPVKEAAVRCPNCGVDTGETASNAAVDEIYCESCGEPVKANAELCPNCGVRQHPSGGGGLNVDPDVLHYGQIALGGLMLLAAIGSISDFSDGAVASVGGLLLYGAIGLLLLPPVRDRLEKRHPIATFGWAKTVRTASVSNPAEPCSICLDDVDGGVRRTSGREFVLAGVTVWFDEESVNHYCRPCLESEGIVDERRTSGVEAAESR